MCDVDGDVDGEKRRGSRKKIICKDVRGGDK